MQIRYSEDTPFLSEINMVPFIDIALVLLIIFMIITPVMMLNTVQVQLPQSSSEKQAPTKNLVVAIKPDGSVYLNNELVTPGLLTNKVKILMKQMPESAVIYADKKVDVATAVSVIDQIEAAGLHAISLTTEQKIAAASPAQPN